MPKTNYTPKQARAAAARTARARARYLLSKAVALAALKKCQAHYQTWGRAVAAQSAIARAQKSTKGNDP